MLRDDTLAKPEADCIFEHMEKMAAADTETKNVLVVGILEVLTDTPKAVKRARARLKGPARFLFERVLTGWNSPKN